MVREKIMNKGQHATVSYQESQLVSFSKESSQRCSYRVYQDGKVGIYFHVGQVEDEEGYAKAQEALVRERPYPFELETGKRMRDKRERILSDKELLETAERCMAHLRETYPRFTYSASFVAEETELLRTNDLGMEYGHRDYAVTANVSFKHVESKDIMDGSFSFSLRDFDEAVFRQMAKDYLGSFETVAEIPEEIILDMQYYGLTGFLTSCLNGENLALKTSLLTGKVGEKAFAEDFTFEHIVSDQECWFNGFWDGDGCVFEDDRLVLVENGVIRTGFADKKTAKKYDLTHTGPAYFDYADIPGPGGLNAQIRRSDKTIRELLAGRYAVIPMNYTSSGFNEKGDYTMVLNQSLLYDGERVVGRLPEFKISTNLFQMFGEDFVGVGSDKPIFNDKQLLFRVHRVE